MSRGDDVTANAACEDSACREGREGWVRCAADIKKLPDVNESQGGGGLAARFREQSTF